MKLVVIMVHYRTPTLAVESLRSLAPEIAALSAAGAKSRAIVVENDSQDGSDRLLAESLRREGWEGWAELMLSPRNGGFAYGNNLALRKLLASPDRPEYVLFLNPDTIVRPGALSELIAFLDAHPGAGIAGSRLEGLDGEPQRSAFRFPNLASELDEGLRLGIVSRLLAKRLVAPPVRDDVHEIDWVCGASMMVRFRLLEDVGLFDEHYFLYNEETDLCLQAHRAGWSCWYVPSSRVVHLVSQSTGLGDISKPMPPCYFESRRYYLQKNHGRAYLFLANFLWIAGHSTWAVRRRIQGKPDADKPGFFNDFVRLSFASPRAPR